MGIDGTRHDFEASHHCTYRSIRDGQRDKNLMGKNMNSITLQLKFLKIADKHSYRFGHILFEKVPESQLRCGEIGQRS